MNVHPTTPLQTNNSNKNHREDLANVDHFDAIPYWSTEKCIRFLESSVTKHKEKIQLPVNNQSMKPAAIRRAIAERLQDLIHAQMNETLALKVQVNHFEQLNRIQTDLINDQAFVIQQLVPRVPEMALYAPLQATQPLRTTSSWEEQCQNTQSKLQHIQILSGLLLGKNTTTPTTTSPSSPPTRRRMS